MKFVAQVSSSTSNVRAPTSSASMILAACEVEPDASPVVNSVVAFLSQARSKSVKGECLVTRNVWGLGVQCGNTPTPVLIVSVSCRNTNK